LHKLLYTSLVALSTLTACDAPPTHEAAAATTTPSTTETKGALIPGTPAGDLGDWVSDIRRGIALIPEAMRKDAAAAQRAALDLYVTRQEYAEMYYGVDGRLRATDELASAIETAEERFHELLKLLTNPATSVDAVKPAVVALDQQQAIVARLWFQAGVRLRDTVQ
jgi:hypothetical protein